jgi:predicted adenylyl cyclase CyaB
MALEIEKKYRLSDEQFDEVLATLNELKADFIGEDFEENILFSGGILSEKRAVLRLRKTQDKTILTYKHRVQNNLDIKQHLEHETEVADFHEAEKIIENLGFYPSLVYEKKRKTFHFREVEIVLDELSFGKFMEIEGTITGIKEAEIFLDIEHFETEHETYPHLTIKYGTKNGEIIEARFEK